MKIFQTNACWADDVRRAASLLYDAGATAVWLFGSRARGRVADRLTDFDLGVEGLNGETGAILFATRELRGKVDVVRLESATPTLRREIMRDRLLVSRVACTEGRLPSKPMSESLAIARTHTVAQLIRDVSSASVIDFGCGSGWLLSELATDRRYARLTGVDYDLNALTRAKKRIEQIARSGWHAKVEFLERLVTYRDRAFLGHDAATAIEVIEHLELAQLNAFTSVLFNFVRPLRAVITTPNAEYNAMWFIQHPRGFRHPDHRFEWSRAEFAKWSNKVASDHGYCVRIESVGSTHPTLGPPTQLAVFDRRY